MDVIDRSTAFPLIPNRPVRRKAVGSPSRSKGLWHWGDRLRQLKEIVSGMSLMSTHAGGDRASATSAHTPFSASLGVAPSIATINTPRRLTITAYFPLGCGPTDATVSTVCEEGNDVLDVHLDCHNPDFAFCDLVLVPYTVELTYTPSVAGSLPVRILTSDGVTVGGSVVKTRGAGSGEVEFDVTGKWIDPAGKAIGLALLPDSPTSNAVVGTWNFDDCQGVSRRYSIQSVHWKEPDVEAEGAIFETTLNDSSGPSPDLVSRPGDSTTQLGLARITFHGLNSARIFALGFGGNVLFTSNLVRSTV
jgi:hypothetical protein